MAKRHGSSRKERTSDIGKYLTKIRLSQAKTQQEIADRIGKSKSCICKIETGVRTQKSLHGFILYQLAKAYEVPIAEMLEKANWPQLPLDIRAASVERQNDPLSNITEEEHQELICYLDEIRRGKNK